MKRWRVGALVLVVVLAGACSNASGQSQEEAATTCPIHPGVVCTNQDLRSVSLVAADLHGADFSGSNLSSSDLRDVNLSNAKLVGTNLGGVDLTDASLKNADLTNVFLFFTNLTNANMTGTTTTGMQSCAVTQPDGHLDPGFCPTSADSSVIPVKPVKPPTGPPVIDTFRLVTTKHCLNDAAGPGISVDYNTHNATSIVFTVDDIRVEGPPKFKGTARLPFVCDGKPHVVAMQAYGPIEPSASASITASLESIEPTAPPPTNGG